jgi:hypothetical protein
MKLKEKLISYPNYQLITRWLPLFITRGTIITAIAALLPLVVNAFSIVLLFLLFPVTTFFISPVVINSEYTFFTALPHQAWAFAPTVDDNQTLPSPLSPAQSSANTSTTQPSPSENKSQTTLFSNTTETQQEMSGGNISLSPNEVPLQTGNRPPVAESMNITTIGNAPVGFTLKGTDLDEGDMLNFTIVAMPALGNVSSFDSSSGGGVYQPFTDCRPTECNTIERRGSDAFAFKVTDNKGAVSNAAIVTVISKSEDTTPTPTPESKPQTEGEEGEEEAA